MTPEAIVRALAAADPFYRDDEDDLTCGLCGAWGPYDDGRELPHKPDCSWRLSVEWVTAGDGRAASSIRDRRRARGITQQRLAELAGCSLSMVRVLESGLQPAVSPTLARVDAVLGAVDQERGREAISDRRLALMEANAAIMAEAAANLKHGTGGEER